MITKFNAFHLDVSELQRIFSRFGGKIRAIDKKHSGACTGRITTFPFQLKIVRIGKTKPTKRYRAAVAKGL